MFNPSEWVGQQRGHLCTATVPLGRILTMHEIPNVDALKLFARSLREKAARDGRTLTHMQSLEEAAHSFGFRDWNTARAAAKARHAIEDAPARRISAPMKIFGTTISDGMLHMRFTVAASSREEALRAFLSLLGAEGEGKEHRAGSLDGSAHDMTLPTSGNQMLSAQMRRAMSRLHHRERFILAERRLKDPATPLEVLAALFGVSKGRISQIEQQALDRFRTAIGEDAASTQSDSAGRLRNVGQVSVRVTNPAPTADEIAAYRSVVLTGYGLGSGEQA